MEKVIYHTKRILKKVFQKLVQPFVWYYKLNWRKKIKVGVITFFSGIAFAFLLLLGFYYAVLNGMFGEMPSDEKLLAIRNYEASEVYSSDSVLLGRYYVENRSDITFEEISPFLINALIATEDSRFYEHKGVDHRSLMRVLFKSIILRQKAGGGSTLSQQLAKNLFGRRSYGMLTMPVNKVRESIIANKLEHLYTKQEILTLYLNTVSFGEDTYGIETACERFFSTTPAEIKPEEAAVLVGMLKAPSTYNPRVNPKTSKIRRDVVLLQLERNEYISLEEKDSLQGLDLKLDYERLVNDEGIATYFKEHLRLQLDNWLDAHLKEDGSSYNLYTDGLKIYTTINSKMQQYAEEAVTEHLSHLEKAFRKDLKKSKIVDLKMIIKSLKQTGRYKTFANKGLPEEEIIEELGKPVDTQLYTYAEGIKDTMISPIDSVQHALGILQAGFLVLNPDNGAVLAWVGGNSFKQVEYDHVLSQRQVGSVFKPIVYAQALKNGYKPCDFVSNQQETYTQYDDWSPQNSDGNYDGKYSLIGGLTNSVNTISVKLCMASGIDSIIETAKLLGIDEELPRVPSIALGVGNISLKNLLGAYTAFANNGMYSETQKITGVYTREGENIYVSEWQQKQVYTPEEAEDITVMLQSVVNNGTASRLRSRYNIGTPIAGKTGTTQNHSDGWFMGYTSEWLGGVWVGADNPSVHFSNIKDGQGANTALPIWALFYKKIEADKVLTELMSNDKEFPEPLDCELYKDDNVILKLFKKKNKKNDKTGLEKPKKKKRFFRKK